MPSHAVTTPSRLRRNASASSAGAFASATSSSYFDALSGSARTTTRSPRSVDDARLHPDAELPAQERDDDEDDEREREEEEARERERESWRASSWGRAFARQAQGAAHTAHVGSSSSRGTTGSTYVGELLSRRRQNNANNASSRVGAGLAPIDVQQQHLGVPHRGDEDDDGEDERSPLSERTPLLSATGFSRRSRPASILFPNEGQGYDAEFREELEGEGGSGVRQWYQDFFGIDWQHDHVKESLRLRKLRNMRLTHGLRGEIANLWDGASGWLLVTLVAVITAFVAYCVIRSESFLFDLKFGYCHGHVFLNKSRCCPIATATSSAPDSFVASWRRLSEQEDDCEAWHTWSSVFHENDLAGYAMYILLALVYVLLAAGLTIYLSASTSVFSTKDNDSIPYPTFSPNFAALQRSPSSSSDEGVRANNGKSEPPPPAPAQGKALRPAKVRKMYFAAGSGIPEVKTILSGFVIRGYLGIGTLLTKGIGLTLAVAGGLSLGKEGPFVHLASCVGNILSRFFPKYDRNEAKRREVISAACAAGVAVAFGAPIGGTLFSLEEVSYFFPPKVMWRTFWCAAVAAVSLRMLDPFGTGKIVLFQVTFDRDWHTFELIGFVFLGIVGGVYGALFAKANIKWAKTVRARVFGQHPITEVVAVTLLTSLVSFYNVYTKMGGTELVYELFSECHKRDSFDGLCVNSPDLVWPLVGSLVFALVTKALLTTITFGIKVPAGIFVPTLAVGGCCGRIAGLVVEWLHAREPEAFIFRECRAAAVEGPLPFGQACVLPGVWAVVGAAAALAGVTRMTVSLTVIVFELTGTLRFVVPVSIAILVAKTVADAIESHGIYDLVIELADLPFLDAKTQYAFEGLPKDIMDARAPTISLDEDNTIESLTVKLAAIYDAGGCGFPIVASVDSGRRMFGYIAAKELEHGLAAASMHSLKTPCTFRTALALSKGHHIAASASHAPTPAGTDFSWLSDQAPIMCSSRTAMPAVHEFFSKLGVRYVIVVDERGLYVGVIEKNRWLAYLRFLEERQARSARSWFCGRRANDA